MEWWEKIVTGLSFFGLALVLFYVGSRLLSEGFREAEAKRTEELVQDIFPSIKRIKRRNYLEPATY